MEYRDKIAWLRRYIEAKAEMRVIKLQIDEARAEAEHITQVLTGMPGGGSGERIPAAVERMVALQSQYVASLDNLRDVQDEICKQIRGLPSATDRQLFTRKYICGQSWSEMETDMMMDGRYLRRRHHQAVEAMEIKIGPRKP